VFSEPLSSNGHLCYTSLIARFRQYAWSVEANFHVCSPRQGMGVSCHLTAQPLYKYSLGDNLRYRLGLGRASVQRESSYLYPDSNVIHYSLASASPGPYCFLTDYTTFTHDTGVRTNCSIFYRIRSNYLSAVGEHLLHPLLL
jgi:hypothetical protein